MKIVIIGFTRQGGRVINRLLAGLCGLGYEAMGFLKEDYIENRMETGGGAVEPEPEAFAGKLNIMDTPASAWVSEFFIQGNGIIFVGAVGIAVRLIAPLLKGKDKDPAVAVIDERGQFAISLLSGHLGGANDLARVAAGILKAVPVITTATDLNDTFAADLFAKMNLLKIEDIKTVKHISASLLDGNEVGFFSDFSVKGDWPRGLAEAKKREWNISVSVFEKNWERLCGLPQERVLCLIPEIVVIGIGCRRGTPLTQLGQAVDIALGRYKIKKKAVSCLASIDLKREEPGLLAYAKEQQLDFITFSAEELLSVRGDFSESEFVLGVTGVSNVCERAALLGCGAGGQMLMKRTVVNGVTVALAVKEKMLSFQGPGDI